MSARRIAAGGRGRTLGAATLAATAVAATAATIAVLATGGDDRSSVAPVDTADPVAAFAPMVSFDSRERLLPIGATELLKSSTLYWAAGCTASFSVAIGDRAAAKSRERLPRLSQARLGGERPYRRSPTDADCSPEAGARPYASTEITRPHERARRPAELPLDQGFYLNLLTASHGGRELDARGPDPVLRAPAYFETSRRSGELRITYWFLYGKSEPPRKTDTRYLVTHEGDWERISVLLRRTARKRYVPISARYYVHDDAHDVAWEDVRRVDDGAVVSDHGTHPMVVSARGTHAPYPQAGQFDYSVDVGGRRLALRDEARECSACPRWRTWQRLLDARRQPWYGYGGGWGLAMDEDEMSGPLGPSPLRDH